MSEFSESGPVYTHFNTSYQSSEVELSNTIGDDSIEKDEPAKCSKLKPILLKCGEVIFLLLLITIVWLALSVPSVFFALSQIEQKTNSCIPTAGDTCKPIRYKNGICTDYLRSYQRCLPHSEGRDTQDIYVPSCVDQSEVERKLVNAESYLSFASPECVTVLKPLICLYFFGLCDKTTRLVVTPTSEQCMNLKNGVCKPLVEIARSVGAENKLPNCNELPETEPAPTLNCSGNELPTSSPHDRPTCSPTFYPDSKCKPECGVWTPYSDIENHISDAVVIISGATAIIAGAVVLIFSFVRCKHMFSYPSVFVVYQTIPTIILGGLVLVAYIDRKGLFCSSRSTVESFQNPTTFCKTTGIFLYYIVMQLLIFWLIHVISIFWGVYWPIQASMSKTSPKRIVLHITAVCLALTLPAIPVCIIYFIGGGFTITRFPPILCAASNLSFNFYAFMLPISIIVACGLTLLVLIFWKLLKKRIIHRINKTRVDTHSCTHARVLTVFCYFVIFGIVVVSTFTVATINLDSFVPKLFQYFNCERSGINATNTTSAVSQCANERAALQEVINPITTIIALVILGFYPAVNLVYVFHFKEVKKSCTCCCRVTREVEYTPHENYNRPYSAVNHSSTSESSVNKGVRLDTHGLIN